MNSNKIINVTTPTASGDAATKGYVDSNSSSATNPVFVGAVHGVLLSNDLTNVTVTATAMSFTLTGGIINNPKSNSLVTSTTTQFTIGTTAVYQCTMIVAITIPTTGTNVGFSVTDVTAGTGVLSWSITPTLAQSGQFRSILRNNWSFI